MYSHPMTIACSDRTHTSKLLSRKVELQARTTRQTPNPIEVEDRAGLEMARFFKCGADKHMGKNSGSNAEGGIEVDPTAI